MKHIIIILFFLPLMAIGQNANTPVVGGGTAADGSETLVTQGTNVTVTGNGTTATPYVINSAGSGTVTNNAIAGQTPFTNPPAAPAEGDEFINTVDGVGWLFDGTNWIERVDQNTQTLTSLALTVTAAGTPDILTYTDESGAVFPYNVLGVGDGGGGGATDADFFEFGTTDPPNAITDAMFTQGFTAFNQNVNPAQALDVLGLIKLTDGSNNVAVGNGAGITLSFGTGNSNTLMGNNAGQNLQNGSSNVAIGQDALRNTTTGIHNIAVGGQAGNANITGSRSTFIGHQAGTTATTGDHVAVGWRALQLNTTGLFNTAIGRSALNANTIGNFNVAVGPNALADNISGNSNTAVGNDALASNTTGINNAALGFVCLTTNTTGNDNVSFGNVSMRENTTGSNNTAFGSSAMRDNVTGGENVALGQGSLLLNTAGSDNVSVGYNCLGTIQTSGNIAIGKDAASQKVNATNITVVGHNAYAALPNDFNNVIVIGANAEPLRTNETVLGQPTVTNFRLPGGLPVYANTAAAAADVNLFSGDFFRIDNADGTSAIHIKN